MYMYMYVYIYICIYIYIYIYIYITQASSNRLRVQSQRLQSAGPVKSKLNLYIDLRGSGPHSSVVSARAQEAEVLSSSPAVCN